MGWGTDFKADVYLNKLTFLNEIEVQNKIDENIDNIMDAKQRLKMFASSTPNDIIPDDWKDEPIDWLNSSLNELFEIITDLTEENIRLSQYVDYIVENGEDKICVDWKDLNYFYVQVTSKAYTLGRDKQYLEELPIMHSKKEMGELFKKYTDEN